MAATLKNLVVLIMLILAAGNISGYTITETKREATLPAVSQSAESPKGLGRDGNKPLMRNRAANECHPRQVIAGNIFEALGEFESGNNDAAVGISGEVSRYQMMPWVCARWHVTGDMMKNPFTALNVARSEMEDRSRLYLHTQLSTLNPQQFYLLWNRPARVMHPRAAELARAKRFKNLVNSKVTYGTERTDRTN